MSIASEIARLQTAKADIRTAVLNKGIGIPADVKLDAYPDWIEQLCSGQDLSYRDASGAPALNRSTANAYIVGEAGRYRIPLVYGNAIKNGAVNAAAYTRIVSDYTAEFVNYLGAAITSPYIETDTDTAAASAALLWQTAQGMVSAVAVIEGPDCNYLQFDLDAVPATNGLAVICIKDADGTIMWSWTIWATADTLTPDTFVNHTEVEYHLMPESFGTIWDATRVHSVCPFFQWGRKDPIGIPAAYNGNTAMTLYDIEGNTVSIGNYGVADDDDEGGTVRSVANSIKMPNSFFLEISETTHNWNNLEYFNNFWNASITTLDSNDDNEATAVKTIYDPTPVGWIVPGPRFATGFTTSGTNVSSGAPTGCEVIGTFSAGWTFKRNADDTDGVFFPASGYRNRASGALSNVGSSGGYWSFAPNSKTSARNLNFNSSAVNPLNTSNRAYGFAVRPSRELF